MMPEAIHRDSGTQLFLPIAMCHMSHVPCPVSRVMCHMSKQNSEASWWRVCFQRGLPNPVCTITSGANDPFLGHPV